MAKQAVAVRMGDQPRATTQDLSRAEKPANLQYRVENVKSLDRPQARPEQRRMQRS